MPTSSLPYFKSTAKTSNAMVLPVSFKNGASPVLSQQAPQVDGAK